MDHSGTGRDFWGVGLATLDGEFLEYMVVKAAGHTNQSRIAPRITNETTLSLWFSGKQKPRDGSLRTIAAFVFDDLKKQKIKTEYFNAEQKFISSVHFLRQCQSGERSIDDEPPLYAFEFLKKKKKLLDHLGRITDPMELQSLLSQRSADLSLEEARRPEKVDGAKPVGAKNLDFFPPTLGCVARPKKLNEIKSAILAKARETRNVPLTTILHGFGGFGKTTLAKEIYNDSEVRRAFSDGVFWVQCQQSLSLKPEAIVGFLLGNFKPDWDKGTISDPISAKRELVRAVGDKQILLIVDDVWYNAHAEVFRGLPPTCVVLMTTRIKYLATHGMSEILVDAMAPDEALGILTNLQRDGKQVEFSKSEVDGLERLAQRLGYWAQLLALANGRIQTNLRNGEELENAISNYLSLLNKRGIVVADSRDLSGSANETRASAMRLCVDASLEMLSERELAHFEALGVLPKDVDIPIFVVTDYWREGMGTEADEGRELLEIFADMSLLQVTFGKKNRVDLHDNIIDYLDRRMDDEAKRRAHQNMVDAIASHCSGGWETLPNDHQYGWLHLLNHIEAAGQQDRADDCRTDFLWLKAKINAVGAQELYRSFVPTPNSIDAARVGRSIAVSLPILTKHTNALAHQLWGRLGAESSPRLTRLTSNARADANFRLGFIRPHLMDTEVEIARFVGQHDVIGGAEFHPNEKQLLTWSHDGKVRIWSTLTGLELRSFDVGDQSIERAALSPDGSHVAFVSWFQHIHFWHIDGCREVLRVRHDDVDNVIFFPNREMILSAGRDGEIIFWDASSGKRERTLNEHSDKVRGMVFSQNGERLVTASADRTVRVWDVGSGKTIQSISDDGNIGHADISPNGQLVLIVTTQHTLGFWDVSTGKENWRAKDFVLYKVKPVFSPDGIYVAAALCDRSIRVWEVATGNEIQCFRGHKFEPISVEFSFDGTELLTACRGGTARIWKVASGNTTQLIQGSALPLKCAKFSPDAKTVLTTGVNGEARLWERSSSPAVLKENPSAVVEINFSPNLKSVFTKCEDEILRTWNVENGVEVEVLKSSTFSENAEPVVYMSRDGSRPWHNSSEDAAPFFQVHNQKVRTSEFVADEAFSVSMSCNSTVLRELKADEFTWYYLAHRTALGSAEFSAEISKALRNACSSSVCQICEFLRTCLYAHPEHVSKRMNVMISQDRSLALTTSFDLTARLWNRSSGKQIHCFDKHSNTVFSAGFSPDGSMTLTVCRGGAAFLWDNVTGELLHSVCEHTDELVGAFFSPGGDKILTASRDKCVRIWNAMTGDCEAVVHFDFELAKVAYSGETLVFGDRTGGVHFATWPKIRDSKF